MSVGEWSLYVIAALFCIVVALLMVRLRDHLELEIEESKAASRVYKEFTEQLTKAQAWQGGRNSSESDGCIIYLVAFIKDLARIATNNPTGSKFYKASYTTGSYTLAKPPYLIVCSLRVVEKRDNLYDFSSGFAAIGHSYTAYEGQISYRLVDDKGREIDFNQFSLNTKERLMADLLSQYWPLYLKVEAYREQQRRVVVQKAAKVQATREAIVQERLRKVAQNDALAEEFLRRQPPPEQ